jgi:hypothetical protein
VQIQQQKMDEDFELPVYFNGKETSFPARLIHWGYSYRIKVDVYGAIINFERDEQREWRALVDPSENENSKEVSIELLRAITESIEQVTG